MSDSQGLLLFTNDSSAGSASSDYDKKAFQDISLPASNNSGFSSTLSSNPLSGNFANDGATKWMAKTLFIKDLQRVEDRTLWVNGRATYKIIWNEDFPGADGYVFGSVALGGTAESRYVSINDFGDGCGVTGVIRRVQWLVRPQTGTATGTPSTDGTNLTTINYGGYTGLGTNFSAVKPIFEAYTTDTTNADYNIHDHRLTANEINKLQLLGVVVYFNLSGDGLDLFPGDTFVDKSLTSMQGASLSYPLGYSNFLGGWDGVFTTSNGVVGATSSPILGIAAACSGASGTNLLSVAIGSGASFPIGTGLYIPDGGGSYYLGEVTNVSGDVLTISPTLALGLSNICTALFNAGPSFAISATYMSQVWSFQPGLLGRTLSPSLLVTEAPYSFSDPYLRYRVWGSTLQTVSGSSILTGLGNTLGLRFPANTDYLNIEGRFSALEFEYLIGQSAILSATLVIDGIVNTTVSEVYDGPSVRRKTVFTNAGMGWHSVRYLNTGSTSILLSRITAYEPKVWNGPTYGLLAQVSVGQTFTLRNAQNASLMAFGNISRIYAESLRANGASWTSTAEAGPGGRSVSTTNDGDYVEFQYFGTQFSLLGSAGTSTLLTIDGASIGPNFNGWNNGSATLGFHTVRVTSKTGTLKLFGYDYLSTVGSVRNRQLFDPVANLSITPRAFTQTSEPLNARLGDIWQVDISNKIAYQKMFGGWLRMYNGVSLPLIISDLPSLNSSVSASSGATVASTSTSFSDVTASVTLTVCGKFPVRLQVMHDLSANLASIYSMRTTGNSTQGKWRFLKNGLTAIGLYKLENRYTSSVDGMEIGAPASSLFFVDTAVVTGATGIYSYKLQHACGIGGGAETVVTNSVVLRVSEDVG